MTNRRLVEALMALAKTSEPSADPLTDEEQELVDDLGHLLSKAERPGKEQS